MKQSALFAPTLREVPADAEAASHRLLLRAGFIRLLAAGIYTYLPLGWRVLNKIQAIIRKEMESAGAQELHLPAMQPAELWRDSGRYAVYGPELIRFPDRNQREFVLGPTHEEAITSLVGNEIDSYKRLPLTLYQIQTKYRDERRPRFGLVRCREFMMKDAYSFSADWESLDGIYRSMYNAYHSIFHQCGLHFRAVEADSGAIGGEGGSHEFMALADIGEDTVVSCSQCGYAANLEKAEAAFDDVPQAAADDIPGPSRIYTPHVRSIGELTAALGVEADRIIKTLIYMADGSPVAVLVRGDHEVNENKLQTFLGSVRLELADHDEVFRLTGVPTGFIGPMNLSVPIIADREITKLADSVTGANEEHYHLQHVQYGRDFKSVRVGDIRQVKEGEACPVCGSALAFHRGIEIGHVFKLGTKYSGKLSAVFKDASGQLSNMIMGCYGIGVSRVLSAIVEQHHDDGGILWPDSVAPFRVHIIPVTGKGVQMEMAEKLYHDLRSRGIDVLLDDRDERPGVKFKDSDLIGIPVRITVGKNAGDGIVEYKERKQKEAVLVPVAEAIARIAGS